jgi:hypothetical protein
MIHYFILLSLKSAFWNFIGEHPLFVTVTLSVLVIIGLIMNLFSKKESSTNKINGAENKVDIWVNEAGLLLFEKLKVKYNNNESLAVDSIAELSDLQVKNMETVNAKFEVIEGKTSLRLWACIEWLNNRFLAENTPLKEITEEEALEKYSINLNEGEILHDVFEDTVWYELKRSRNRSFNYHGLGLRIPLGAGFSYRVGAIGSLNPDSLEEFKEVTSGKLFLTNRRMILQGDLENKSININSILDIEQYKDCIIVGKTTGKKPLIKFELDDAAVFSRLITRVF